MKVRTCSSVELDCVERVAVEKTECPENCDGPVMDTEKLFNSVTDQDGLATFLWDYENYKDPDNVNQYYPDAMKGIRTN